MKLHKKIAIVFTYLAICIAISGYLHLNPNRIKIHRQGLNDNSYSFTKISFNSFKNSILIEGVGLFLLLGWVAYKGDKKEDK